MSDHVSAGSSEEPVPAGEIYVFGLYIAGLSVLSRRAIVNTRKICETHLKGRYRLEVIDLCQHPLMAEQQQIIAAPTLVKKEPFPVRRFVGDMSRTEVILQGLGLPDGENERF